MNSKENSTVLPDRASDRDAAVLAAYAEWSRWYDLANKEPDGSDEAFSAIRRAEAALVSLVPGTARGLAVQLVAFTGFGEFEDLRTADWDFQSRLQELANVTPPASFQTDAGRNAA